MGRCATTQLLGTTKFIKQALGLILLLLQFHQFLIYWLLAVAVVVEPLQVLMLVAVEGLADF
jgi:hypothetical protein